jgi:hypothetical protein
MGDTIKIKKGQKSKLPVLQLSELGFTTDEERLYIGGLNGNVPIPNLQDLNYLVNNVYGVEYEISTDTFKRVGNAVGLSGGASFDNIMPWSGIRRCNLSDDLKVNAYYGDYEYKEDGSNGQVMVEVPAYYYRRYFKDADHLVTLISMTQLPNFKLSPWHYDKLGNPRSKAYFSAYEGSIFDVSASATEVDTLTVTAPCTTSGNIIIRLDSVDFTITLDSATDNTTDLVATKIRNIAFAGWTLSGTGSTVIFTCNTAGAKKPAQLLTTTTGVTITVVQTTIGAGGYVLGDAQVADFTTGTGDKLCSIAGAKPASGVTQSLTLPNARKLANNRGVGWEQQFFTATSMIQMLFVVEYASLNSQAVIGQGVVNKAYRDLINDAEITGATSSLGNRSGRAVGTDGLVSISYRGIENFWGNIWKWVDGFNIKDGFAYISGVNGDFISDKFDGNYTKVGELPHINGYISKILLNGAFDYGFIPLEATGTSSSKYADYYYQNPVGSFVARLGGRWGIGANAGAFCWHLSDGSGYRYSDIGARLCA